MEPVIVVGTRGVNSVVRIVSATGYLTPRMCFIDTPVSIVIYARPSLKKTVTWTNA